MNFLFNTEIINQQMEKEKKKKKGQYAISQ